MRSHLPWPLRWAVVALTFGFSAALALWAFEFGKEIAGLDRSSRTELEQLRLEVAALRSENERFRSVADTAGSLVKTERATQERLAQQVRQLESEKQLLQADLGFFEGLLPVSSDGLQLRGLQADLRSVAGQVRYQMMLMQSGRAATEFTGRYELLLSGLQDGRAWSRTVSPEQAVTLRQYLRLEGTVDLPEGVVLKAVQARIFDKQGTLRAQQTAKL